MASTKKKSSSSRKKSGGRKYGTAAGKSVKSAMHREKRGTLRSGKGGKGGKVKNRKQAIAIGLSEARKKGAKVPPKKSGSKKSSSRKKSRLKKIQLEMSASFPYGVPAPMSHLDGSGEACHD